MRSRSFLAAALVLLAAAAAPAEVKPEGTSFVTADGVDLQGTFYPSKNGGGSASVIMMHGVYKDPTKGDWEGLAKSLAEEGFNVLRFDFRGHGKSTELKDKDVFWANPTNVAAMKQLAAKPPKNFTFADWQKRSPNYITMLANDIMAARIELDRMSDKSKTNSSSVYLIGPEDTMTLGMIFLGAEWGRPNILTQNIAVQSVPMNPQLWTGTSADAAGKDVAACVWLSPVRNPTVSLDVMKKLAANAPKLREENQMLFVYGAQDTAAATVSGSMLNQVLVAKPPTNSKLQPLKFTTEKQVAKSKNVGVDLLGNNQGTEKTIIDFLNAVEKDRKNRTSVTRYWVKSPLITLSALNIGPPGQ